jgi:hypothetical protein
MEDLTNFARLIEAIRPWLAHVGIVGGWAHRLYRFIRLRQIKNINRFAPGTLTWRFYRLRRWREI